MKRVVEILNRALNRRGAGVVLSGCIACAYAVAYFQHPLFPGHAAIDVTRGWWTWTDQNRYLTEAAALAQWQLDATSYFYPIGYPMLGALFWKWMPVNPFFIPDLLLVLVAAFAWWRIAQRVLSRLEAVVVGMIFAATHAGLIGQTMIVPWNTIATQAALLVGIWIAIELRGGRAVGWLSVLAAITYWIRPIDAVAFAPLLVFATWRLGTWREKFLWGAVGVAIIAAAAVGVGRLNMAVFGQWRTPYEWASMHGIGFFSYPVACKLYWLLVDGRQFFAETEPALLLRYPWLLLVLPGAVFWIQREGRVAAVALSAVAVNWFLYVNYNDFLPSDIYRFTLIHYLTWSFPLLFLIVAGACRHGWNSRGTKLAFGAATVVIVGVLGLRLEEREVNVAPVSSGGWALPETRPLVIQFSDTPIEKAAELRLDGRALIEYSDFLLPYVTTSELRLVLGTRAKGGVLTIAPGTTQALRPAVREFTWTWRFSPKRLKWFFR